MEGQVFVEGRSPGGLRAVADDHVADAQALGAVMANKRVWQHSIALRSKRSSTTRTSPSNRRSIRSSTCLGAAATDDLETLLQLVHLQMTAPRADRGSGGSIRRRPAALRGNPSIDAGYAQSVALLEARYDDPRFLLPTPGSVGHVDAAGIRRIAENASGRADWSFSFKWGLRQSTRR